MKMKTIFDRILDSLFVVAGAMLVFSAFSVSWMVFSRYFLGRPLGWIIEINEYILLHITFLVAAWILRKDGHVKMDIVIEHLRPKVQLVIHIFTSIVSTIVCFLFTWFGIKVTLELYQKNSMTPTVLELPKFFFTIIIFVGSFLLIIQFLRRTYGYLQAWKGLQDKN